MKKILSMILVLALLIQPVFVKGAESSEYGDWALLNALGIMDYEEDGTYDPDAEVTRKVFAKVLVDILYRGEEVTFSGTLDDFEDVSNEDPYAGYINTAVERGLILVDGNNFLPDGLVSYEELCYGLLCAVDQGTVAEAMGGYPEGYTQLADMMNIFDGVSLTNALTNDSLAAAIRNLLDSEYYEIRFEGSVGKHEKSDDTILEEYFDIQEIDGKLITGRALGGDSTYVEIDGVIYDCNITLESLLGQRVRAYYKQEENEVIYAERYDNENILIYYDEVVAYDDGMLTYEIDGKRYTARIAEDVTSFKNGLMVDFSEQLFFPNEGFINIIKNRGSSNFDTVISTETETVVVGSINVENRVIYDMYDSGKKVDLDQYGSEVLILKDGQEIELADLKTYDSLMVIFPEGGKFVTIYVTDMVTSGTVSSIGNDYLVINGSSKLFFSQYFADFGETLNAGNEYYVYVDMFGRVVAVQKMANNDEQYAYFLNLIDYEEEECVLIKYMDQQGEIHKERLPEKITLNGQRVKTEITNYTLNKTFKTGYFYDAVSGYKEETRDFYIRQPIKIRVDEEGEITEIDTPVRGEAESEESLMLDNIIPASTTLRYRNSPRQFGTKFGLSSNCIIFSVPNTENDSEEARKDLLDEHYAVVSASSAFKNDGYYGDLYVFDVTEGGACDLLVKRGTASISAVEPDSSSSIFVVEEINRGLNEDEEAVYFVKGYMEGKQVEYALADDELITPYLNGDALGITEEQRQQQISPGDVIQISLDTQGEINGIYYRFDYKNQKTLVPSDIYQDGAGSEDAYKGYFGKVYSNDVDGIRMSDAINGSMNDFSIANLNTFMSKSISLIYVFDTITGTVSIGSWDDLVSSEFNYSDASTVYVRTRWNDPMQMVIYK